jgi:hypothetical protein
VFEGEEGESRRKEGASDQLTMTQNICRGQQKYGGLIENKSYLSS